MLYALLAATTWGLSDVLTGEASRKASPLFAAFLLYVISLLVITPFLFHADIWAGLSIRTVIIASLAGIAGVIGDIFFGRGLAKSKMSVGIPLANVVSAAVPVLLAVLLGSTLSLSAACGITGALVACLFAALPKHGKLERQGALSAITGGFFFGVMFGLLLFVKDSHSLVLIFIMRFAGLLTMLPRVLSGGLHKKVLGPGALPGAASGVTSVVANLFYLAVLTKDDATALAALAIGLAAPAGVILANCLSREKLSKPQLVSAVLAMASLGLLA